MTKENLQSKSLKELRNVAKDWEVTGRWDMNKEELIAAILKAEEECNEPVKTESAKVEEEIGDKKKPQIITADVAKENLEKAASKKKEVVKEVCPIKADVDAEVYDSDELSEAQQEEKLEYIKRVTKGSLIAFRIGESVKSAMVTNKSVGRQLIKAENKVGKEFIIPFKDVLWVRTGKRWPRGVYNLLKGGTQNGNK